MYKTGFVGIVGKPNAGKSSLVNKMVGFKVAITTPKPQTTRFNIKGIPLGKLESAYIVVNQDFKLSTLSLIRLFTSFVNKNLTSGLMSI